jgi:hypothetical protein
MTSENRTHPVILLVLTTVLVLAGLAMQTVAYGWLATMTPIPLMLIAQAASTLHYSLILGLGAWIGFRFGAVNKWTYVAPTLTFLVATIAGTLFFLWNIRFAFGTPSSQAIVLPALVHNFWSRNDCLNAAPCIRADVGAQRADG